MNLTEWLGVFFLFGQVGDVSAVTSKTGIATGEYVLQVTMIHKDFMNIPDILSCRGWNILVVVEGYCLHCCSCGAAGHLAKLCPEKNPASKPATAPINGLKLRAGCPTKKGCFTTKKHLKDQQQRLPSKKQ